MEHIRLKIGGIQERLRKTQEKLNHLKEARITATDPSVQFKLNEQIKSQEAQMKLERENLQQALDELDKAARNDKIEGLALGHEKHSLTCDRKPQDRQFQEKRWEVLKPKLNFFYLYGLDQQAHWSLVRRFSYELEGLLRVFLNPDLKAACRVFCSDAISLEIDHNLPACQTELLRLLFEEFGLQGDQHQPLGNRTLNYLYQHSPQLNGFGAEDYVFTYLVFPEIEWDAELTPALVTWLIDEFCGEPLPEQAPSFFFFFGIEFEDEDSTLKEEVLEIIQQKGDRVKVLPELQMVTRKDIERWFNRYRKVFGSTEARKNSLEKYFPNTEQDYMEKVENILRIIIDKHFEKKIK